MLIAQHIKKPEWQLLYLRKKKKQASIPTYLLEICAFMSEYSPSGAKGTAPENTPSRNLAITQSFPKLLCILASHSYSCLPHFTLVSPCHSLSPISFF